MLPEQNWDIFLRERCSNSKFKSESVFSALSSIFHTFLARNLSSTSLLDESGDHGASLSGLYPERVGICSSIYASAYTRGVSWMRVSLLAVIKERQFRYERSQFFLVVTRDSSSGQLVHLHTRGRVEKSKRKVLECHTHSLCPSNLVFVFSYSL